MATLPVVSKVIAMHTVSRLSGKHELNHKDDKDIFKGFIKMAIVQKIINQPTFDSARHGMQSIMKISESALIILIKP